MAINNVNMMALINQELKKIEGRDTKSDYLDVFKETWEMGQEQQKWSERKNMQRQQMMSELSKGIGTSFNNDELTAKKERFQNYFNKYKGGMDETTLEYGNMMLGNFDMQSEKNLDFKAQSDMLKTYQNKLVTTVNSIGVDEEGNRVEMNSEDWEDIEKLNREWLDYTSKFTEKHGDRLSLKPYAYISASLDDGSRMNNFLLGQAREDNFIDDQELQA